MRGNLGGDRLRTKLGDLFGTKSLCLQGKAELENPNSYRAME